MTPQELINSILQLAIQGKLVEQRPEEGTSEELCRQIQAEKQRLIKDGTIKKEKPLPQIAEDDKTFDIPENWKWARLADLTTELTLNDGNWVLSDDMVSMGPVKLIQLGSIGNCKYVDKGFKYLSQDHFYELNGRQIYGGYLLVNRMIGDRMLCCILPELDGTLMTAVDVCWISPQDTFYDIKYLMYALASGDFQEKVKAQGRGTTRFRISKLNLISIAFPLPPLAEQKRIVSKIEELLPYIDRYEQAWSKLEEFNKRFPTDMQKSILQRAIQGTLVEQRPEEGTGEELYQQIKKNHQGLKSGKEELNYDSMDFDIPDNWIMVELNQLFEFVDYRGKTPTKISEGVFLITASNIRKGSMDYSRKEYISREEYLNRQSRGITHAGDLLFTTEAPMGNAALCDLDECSCGQRIITFQEYKDHSALPALYMYFILSPQFQKQLLDNCTGTTAKGIKADKLKHFRLPLPPYAEQKRIVDKLEEILPLCEKLI